MFEQSDSTNGLVSAHKHGVRTRGSPRLFGRRHLITMTVVYKTEDAIARNLGSDCDCSIARRVVPDFKHSGYPCRPRPFVCNAASYLDFDVRNNTLLYHPHELSLMRYIYNTRSHANSFINLGSDKVLRPFCGSPLRVCLAYRRLPLHLACGV